MKTNKFIALATIASIALYSTSTYGIGNTESDNELKIEFSDYEDYTDTETSFGSAKAGEKLIQSSLTSAFQKAANKYLPSGYELRVTINDIDLAGDRSVMTSTFGDIRVYRDLYPPRIAFRYSVYSPSEKLVASGDINKSDLTYLFQFTGVRLRPEEEAPYVTELVRGWASNELRRAVTKR